MDERFIEELTTLDVSGDGQVTISDIWAWLWQVAVMPGDVLIYLLVTYAPSLATFFELSSSNYGGSFSNFLSIASWLVIFIAVSLIFNWLRQLDRLLTTRLITGCRGVVRVFRVTRRRIESSIALYRKRRQKSPALEVENVELGPLETTVLKCYGSVDELIILTPRDVAEQLNLSRSQVEHSLRRLCALHLLERSFGTDQGEEGHHISQAGQMYLISA